jgi:hypothetical protein
MAKVNPFRFSTKYQDDETDLLYYGYRYYNATMGGWLSRDLNEYSLNPYSSDTVITLPQARDNAGSTSADVNGTCKCNLDQPVGSPLEIKILTKNECAKPCVQKHEDQHAADRKDCCNKARAAYQAQGANKAKVTQDWNNYVQQSSNWTECNAYTAEAKCFADLYKKNGCDACFDVWKKGGTPPKSQWDCCIVYRDWGRYAALEAKGRCSTKDAKNPPPCPFK